MTKKNQIRMKKEHIESLSIWDLEGEIDNIIKMFELIKQNNKTCKEINIEVDYGIEEFHIYGYREETEKEKKKRLETVEKRKETQKKRDKKKEEKELKELKRLMEKFKDKL